MAQSEAATVDEYLAEAPRERTAILGRIRALALEALPGHEERMQWGMPAYFRDGEAEFAWANQARYISLYVMKDGVAAAHAAELAGLNFGKSCLRLDPADELDEKLIRGLLGTTAAT